MLSTLETDAIIQTDYLTLSPDENLEKLVDLISHSNQVIFAVVDKEKHLIGVIHFNNIREIIFNSYRVKYTLVKDIMVEPAEVVYPFNSMETVMNKFERSKMTYLPVIKDEIYFGFISKSVALEAYRSKLKAMTIE